MYLTEAGITISSSTHVIALYISPKDVKVSVLENAVLAISVTPRGNNTLFKAVESKASAKIVSNSLFSPKVILNKSEQYLKLSSPIHFTESGNNTDVSFAKFRKCFF